MSIFLADEKENVNKDKILCPEDLNEYNILSFLLEKFADAKSNNREDMLELFKNANFHDEKEIEEYFTHANNAKETVEYFKRYW